MNDEEINIMKIDNLKMSTHNYWNALLISNTILVAMFGAVSNSNKFLIFILVLLSIYCSYLIIKNCRAVKDQDLFVGNLSVGDNNAVKYLKEAAELHDRIAKREKWVEKIFIAEACLILLIILIGS